MKFTAIVLAVGAFVQANTCLGETSYNITAANLLDANSNPLNGLAILVCSRSNASFTLPTTTSFVSDDDIIIKSFDVADGQLVDAANGVQMTNGVIAGAKLALYWFPTLTTSSTFPIPGGTPYGMFTNAGGLAEGYGSDPWAIGGDGGTYALMFLTQSTGLGSNPDSDGVASSVVAGGNHSPIANPDGPYYRAPSLSLKIAITNLLANDTDADTNTITFTGIAGLSTNGITVSNNAQYVFYPSNAGNVSDRFSYTISDGQGGVSTGLVSIAISTNVVGQALGITNAAGTVVATFAGIPTYSYIVQRATDVNFTANVTNLVTTNAPATGLFKWTDNAPPSPTAYYRLRYSP